MKKIGIHLIQIVLCSLFFLNYEIISNPLPAIQDGKLNLNNWDIFQDESFELSGNWEFYWKEFINSGNFNNKETQLNKKLFPIPDNWNNYKINENKLNGIGYATYRLNVSGLIPGKNYGLKFLSMSMAYKLFIDKELITQIGNPSDREETFVPRMFPQIVEFSPKNSDAEIIIHISNFVYRNGGPWNKIIFGSISKLQKIRERQLMFDFFLFGSLIIMALYHIGLYTVRKKDLSPLYFGLFCLFIGLRIPFTNEKHYHDWFGSFPWIILQKADLIITYISVAPFVLAKIRKRDGSNIMLFGFIILFMTVINDILYARTIIITNYYVSFGLFCFIFSQAYLLSVKFSQSLLHVEGLSVELIQLNASLESRVNQRTSELNKSNNELKEANIFRDKIFSIIAHDLRGPLGNIRQYIVHQSNKTKIKNPKMELILKRLSIEIETLFLICDNTFHWAKNQLSLIVCEPRMNDIHYIIDENLTLLSPIAKLKNIHIEIVTDFHKLPQAFFDNNLINFVIRNLLMNAIKFTYENGRIILLAEVHHNKLICKIIDTGVGLTALEIESLLKDVGNLRTEGTSREKGMGLGLWLSRQFITLNRGEFYIESKKNEGTSVSFTLPLND